MRSSETHANAKQKKNSRSYLKEKFRLTRNVAIYVNKVHNDLVGLSKLLSSKSHFSVKYTEERKCTATVYKMHP